jgi:hypothetical protein
LTLLALAILQEGSEPLPIAAIAVRALKAKGISWAIRRRTQTKLREAFGKLRGVFVIIGTGCATRHALAPSQSLALGCNRHQDVICSGVGERGRQSSGGVCLLKELGGFRHRTSSREKGDAHRERRASE